MDQKMTRKAGKHSFIWTYDGILTEDQAREAQSSAGYHPSGYGFYDHRTDGNRTTWECSNTCD